MDSDYLSDVKLYAEQLFQRLESEKYGLQKLFIEYEDRQKHVTATLKEIQHEVNSTESRVRELLAKRELAMIEQGIIAQQSIPISGPGQRHRFAGTDSTTSSYMANTLPETSAITSSIGASLGGDQTTQVKQEQYYLGSIYLRLNKIYRDSVVLLKESEKKM